MVIRRENLALICTVTAGNKIGSIFFHQREKSESHTLSDRQQGSLVLPFKNGGNKKNTYEQIMQKDLALSSKSQYVHHSRIPAFSTEYSIRQGEKQAFQSGFFIPKFFKRFLDCWVHRS